MSRSRWNVILLSLVGVLLVALGLLYWFRGELGFFSKNLYDRFYIQLNQIAPSYFPPIRQGAVMQAAVPRAENPVAVKVFQGIIVNADAQQLTYAVDVSGDPYYIKLDFDALKQENQHVLIPFNEGWQSVVPTDDSLHSLLCIGDAVEIRVQPDMQQVDGRDWTRPFVPERVIVKMTGPSCGPREVDQRSFQ